MLKDYYSILQVSPEADPEVIDAAYHRLARKYHPDLNKAPEADARMRKLIEAHEVLGDAKRRKEYDQSRKIGSNSPTDKKESINQDELRKDPMFPRVGAMLESNANLTPSEIARILAIDQARAVNLMFVYGLDSLKRKQAQQTPDARNKPPPAPDPHESRTPQAAPETQKLETLDLKLSKGGLFICPCTKGAMRYVIEKRLLIFDERVIKCSACGRMAEEVKPTFYQILEFPPDLSFLSAYYSHMSGQPGFWDIFSTYAPTDNTIARIDAGSITLLPSFGTVQLPIFGEDDEKAYIVRDKTNYLENRTRRVSDGYSGISLPLARGVRIYSGKSASHYETSFSQMDEGTFCLTNKRYVFIGKNKTFSAPLDKIVTVTSLADGIAISRSDKERVEYFANMPGILVGTLAREIIRETKDRTLKHRQQYNLKAALGLSRLVNMG